ncbi:hypothetical protein NG798_20800 [Ancylothrix sp. C2]|uniref:hypothetical protein n=1 Tax=Ancylothrix sp. D3o TaxID=2953691 RepID=UPI0021BB5BC4|nr:hypothetical protein [Ancylothrix sp. D3o]MCT7952241.1 hypothetical protein [Ancylothrix sp. D3o]
MYLHNPPPSLPTALSWQTPINIPQATAAAVFAAANANRKALIINNRSDADLFVRFAPVATPASPTYYDYYVPPRQTHKLYLPETPTTAINCVFSNAVGGGSATFAKAQ